MTLDPAGENKSYALRTDKFTVSVLVEDQEVPLYGIEHSDDGKTITGWVESESGKSFGVRWMDSERTYHTSGHLSVDGIPCSGLIRYSYGNKDVHSKIDYCDSGLTRRKLVFSDIQTTDDDAFHGQSISEDFGNIKLVMRRAEVIAHKQYASYLPERHALEKVHERSKKAMRHQMRFGEEMPAAHSWVELEYYEVLATFIIRYRPRDYLQANEIMSLSKKRKAPADPDDIIDLTLDEDGGSENDDELRELQARIKAIKEKKHKRAKKDVKHEIIEL